MALKDLSSLFDLVAGNQPVGDKENQRGAQSFDLGPDSTLQQNSLPKVPVNSPYQDLNGQPGPQFNLGEDSTLQEDNLINLESQLDYPDLNGVDGGNGYFHRIANPGKYQGKKIGKKDLHEYLLTNRAYGYTYGNSSENVTRGQSEYQDLDGVTNDEGNGFFHGANQRSTLQGKKIFKNDLHIALLKNKPYAYSYGITTLGNQPGQAGPYKEPRIDLDGGLPNSGKYEDNGPSEGFY